MQRERLTARNWLIDTVIAVAAFGFACLSLSQAINLLIPDELMRRFMGVEAIVPSAQSIVAVAITTLPLVLRRKFPWPVLVVVLVAWAVFQSWIGLVSVSLVGPLIALFTVAFVRQRNEAVIAGLAVAAVVVVAPTTSHPQMLAEMTLVQNLALVAAAALAGYALHARQEFIQAAEERAQAAEQSRESEAQRRVEEERVRIAREVHDITAHSLSAVSIQAAAAERLIDRDPDAAKEAISTARQTAKSALEDIRAMIGVLRTGNEQAESQPTEGTDHIADLVDYLRNTGVDATLDDAGYDRSKVPTHVDVALFGIAREATTNIVRHAQAHHAKLTLKTGIPSSSPSVSTAVTPRAEPRTNPPAPRITTASPISSVVDSLSRYAQQASSSNQGAHQEHGPSTSIPSAILVVEDDGQGESSSEAGLDRGHGIEGMRERVNLLKGQFSAGPREGGGFCVSVTIPLSQ